MQNQGQPAPAPVARKLPVKAAEAAASRALATLVLLEKNYEDAQNYYAATVLVMRPSRKRDLAHQRYFPVASKWGQRLLDQVADAPGSEAEARAWGWVAQHAGDSPLAPAAVNGLVESHLHSPWIARACEPGTPASDAQLTKIWEETSVGLARALAGLEVARRVLDAVKPGREGDTDAMTERALGILQRIEKECTGVKIGSQAASQLASEQLVVWRTLRPGMAAIPLTGVDLHGDPLVIADDQGPRVYLFWNTREMRKSGGYGLLRTLHQRFAPQGVALIGVNGDRNQARAAREAKLQRVPIQSLADGAAGGTFAKAYRIDFSPQAVLIDAQGRLVSREIPLGDLGKVLDEYLK